MTIYFILLFILLILSISNIDKNTFYFKVIWPILILLLILYVGLRDNIGGDFATYNKFFNNCLEQDLFDYINIFNNCIEQDSFFDFTTEPFFYLYYKLIGYIGLNLYGANLISAILLMISLSFILIKEKFPLNGLFLSFPILITIVGIGFNRQSIALSLIMLGFIFWDRSFIKYATLVIIASLFHKSAIIMILLNRFDIKISNIFTLIIFIFGLFVIYFFLSPHILNIIKGYPLFEVKSNSSFLRVSYILAPSLIFIFFKRSFYVYKDYLFLSKYSIFSLILIPAMILNVDIANRLSFYFLPLSIIILTRLPMIFSDLNLRNLLIIIIHLITICYFAIFIFYANNIDGWVPYNNLLMQ